MQNIFSDNKKAPVNHLPSQDEDEIDLGELLATLVDSKWLIAFITLVILAIGTAYSFLANPVYKVDAMLQVQENISRSPGILRPGDVIEESKAPVMAEIELIKSRMILGTTVKDS